MRYYDSYAAHILRFYVRNPERPSDDAPPQDKANWEAAHEVIPHLPDEQKVVISKVYTGRALIIAVEQASRETDMGISAIRSVIRKTADLVAHARGLI